MSTAWTDVSTGGIDWQGITPVLNELVRGVMERRLACGLLVYKWDGTTWNELATTDAEDCILDGTEDVQKSAFWYRLQDMVAVEDAGSTDLLSLVSETAGSWGAWSDPGATYGGSQHSNDREPNTFSGSSLFVAAGIPGGWRRAREWSAGSDPVWLSPGRVEVSDIIGPWIISDLQDVMSKLIWRWADFGDVSIDIRLANVPQAWDDVPWTFDSANAFPYGEAFVVWSAAGGWVTSLRYRSNDAVVSCWSGRECSVARMVTHSSDITGTAFNFDGNAGIDPWLGYMEQKDEGSLSSGDRPFGVSLGAADTDPALQTSPGPVGVGATYNQREFGSALQKWDFTNA